MAILLGEGFSVKAVSIEKAPVQIPVIRHHFAQHKPARDSHFEDILLPVSDRLFGRAWRLVYDRSSRLQSNRFANRDSCALESGNQRPGEISKHWHLHVRDRSSDSKCLLIHSLYCMECQ